MKSLDDSLPEACAQRLAQHVKSLRLQAGFFKELYDQVSEAVHQWPQLAAKYGLRSAISLVASLRLKN